MFNLSFYVVTGDEYTCVWWQEFLDQTVCDRGHNIVPPTTHMESSFSISILSAHFMDLQYGGR